jgi:hypothetical protein
MLRLIRFPPRHVRAVIICRERDGDGWLTIAGAHGWLFGSRAEARAEAHWLSDNLSLTIREVSAMSNLPDFAAYCRDACIRLWGEPDQKTRARSSFGTAAMNTADAPSI